jgi:site-specific recombinase XerD
MSRRSQAKHSVTVATSKIGGARDTKEQRERICKNFIDWCFTRGHLFNSLKEVTLAMLQDYFKALQLEGISIATQHNRLSAILKVIKILNLSTVTNKAIVACAEGEGDSTQQATKDTISAKTVGLVPRNRSGTKLPIPDEFFLTVLARAAALKDPEPGFVIALKLQRLLGHRGLESLMSVRDLEQYAIKAVEALEAQKVPIHRGTKGGRERFTQIIQSKALETLLVIREALGFMRSNGGYLIVCGKDGIKSATQKYHRLAKDVGLVGKYAPHSLRYAFCVDKVIELRDSGYNRSEAMILTANFLGHGDGRGRFVSMVYGKTVVHTVPVEKRKSRLDRAMFNIDQLIDARINSRFTN